MPPGPAPRNRRSPWDSPTSSSASVEQRNIDPAHWRSAAELEKAAHAIEARLASGLRSLRQVPVTTQEAVDADNAADRAAAADARRQATSHRAEADRIEADRRLLVEDATADYFSARDDSRLIEAGPGFLHHRRARVQAAEDRRDETARRWSNIQLPRSSWSDEAVRQSASRAGRLDGGARHLRTNHQGAKTPSAARRSSRHRPRRHG